MSWTVYNRQGQRKYLTPTEVDSFVRSAKKFSLEVRTFCWMLAFTGCRISEALSLTRDNIDFEARHVIIQCLKKRGKQVFRAVPLPPEFLQALTRWCQLHGRGTDRLWPWSRMTGYRRVCEVMDVAGIRGSYASPKGLRHAFGVRAIQSTVPLTLVQKWLGHADIKTTAIYTDAMGPEERELASRMWRKMPAWDPTSPHCYPGQAAPIVIEDVIEQGIGDLPSKGELHATNAAFAAATAGSAAANPRSRLP